MDIVPACEVTKSYVLITHPRLKLRRVPLMPLGSHQGVGRGMGLGGGGVIVLPVTVIPQTVR